MAYATPEENKAYYTFRDQRAKDWGFRSYNEERKYKERNRAAIDEAGHSLLWRQSHYEEGGYKGENPKKMVAFKTEVLDIANNPHIDEGTKRHAAVAYFIAWEHSSVDEAIAAMRLIYGPS